MSVVLGHVRPVAVPALEGAGLVPSTSPVLGVPTSLGAVLADHALGSTTTATTTLSLIESSGWEAVFGPVDDEDEASKLAGLKAAPAVVTRPSKPWGSG